MGIEHATTQGSLWGVILVLGLVAGTGTVVAQQEEDSGAKASSDRDPLPSSPYRIDWARGLVLAKAGAATDLRAPTNELARVKAERTAKDRAASILRQAAQSLPIVSSAPRAKATLTVDNMVSESIDYHSDGSVVVELSLGLDLIRSSHFGPDQPIPANAKGPERLVVDVQGLEIRPEVGLELLGSDDTRYRGPTVFATSKSRPKVHSSNDHSLDAQSFDEGTLRLTTPLGKFVARRPLVVIVGGK